jgi:hypothetical protein
MLGRQYKYMDRFYVVTGETFRGIIREPVFLETTEDGRPLSGRPDRLDGWYLGAPTGRCFAVALPPAAPRTAAAPEDTPAGVACPLAWPVAALILLGLGAWLKATW